MMKSIKELEREAVERSRIILKHWPVLQSIVSVYPKLTCEIDKQLKICEILDRNGWITLDQVHVIVHDYHSGRLDAHLMGWIYKEDQNELDENR